MAPSAKLTCPAEAKAGWMPVELDDLNARFSKHLNRHAHLHRSQFQCAGLAANADDLTFFVSGQFTSRESFPAESFPLVFCPRTKGEHESERQSLSHHRRNQRNR